MFGSYIPPRPQDILAEHHRLYDAAIASGKYRPYIWPFDTLGVTLLFVYLCIPWRNSNLLASLRIVIWAVASFLAIDCILYARSRNPAGSLGVGLINSYFVLLTAALTVLHNPQKDFRRIQYADDKGEPKATNIDGATNGSSTATESRVAPQLRNGTHSVSRAGEQAVKDCTPSPPSKRFRWESYPENGTLYDRALWMGDLLVNFRGIGWNWCIPSSPPPPAFVQLQLDPPPTHQLKKDTTVGRSGQVHQRTMHDLVRVKLLTLIWCYLLVDIVKTAAMHDSYFYAPPPHLAPGWLPIYVQQSPVLLRSIRLLIAMGGIYGALTGLMTLSPLIYSALLGPKYLRAQAEPWMYPGIYGSLNNITDLGLAGWWGGWWHQTFRFAFDAPAQWLAQRLGWEGKSNKKTILRIFCAFFFSGCIHASGAHTQLGASSPLTGHLRFFLLQPVGIATQMMAESVLRKIGLAKLTPAWLAKALRFYSTNVWLYYTAPICVEDFAIGGIFLFEPVPISPLRGLGLGIEGTGWWCWGGKWFQWHTGAKWWQSGLVL